MKQTTAKLFKEATTKPPEELSEKHCAIVSVQVVTRLVKGLFVQRRTFVSCSVINYKSLFDISNTFLKKLEAKCLEFKKTLHFVYKVGNRNNMMQQRNVDRK